MRLLVFSSDPSAADWLRRHVEIAWPLGECRVVEAARLLQNHAPSVASADVVVVAFRHLQAAGEEQELAAIGRLVRGPDRRPVILLSGPRSPRYRNTAWAAGVTACLELGEVTHDALRAALRSAARERSDAGSGAPRDPQRPVVVRSRLAPLEPLASKPHRQTTLMLDAERDQRFVLKFYPLESRGSTHDHALFARVRAMTERLAGLSHPALENVYAAWRDEGGIATVTEFLGAGSLSARLYAGVGVVDGLRWFHALADGVAVLHRLGLTHGDIRAANVVFRERDVPVLIDSTELTPWGVAAASLGRDPSPRDDLRSLARLLYALVTGQVLPAEDLMPPTLPAAVRWLGPLFLSLWGSPHEDECADAAHAVSMLEALTATHLPDAHQGRLPRLDVLRRPGTMSLAVA